MSGSLRYHQGAERPAAKLWLRDDDSTLIDFSTGYTFTYRIGAPGQAALLNKTTGITGTAGAGTEPTGTPNITITWTAGELNLTPGAYQWQLRATTTSLDRIFAGTITILADIL
jgi:hypothetical protein